MYLLPSKHALETIEVVHVCTLVLPRQFLGSGGILPLVHHITINQSLLQGLDLGTTLDVHTDISKSQPTEVNLLTSDTGYINRSIDECLRKSKKFIQNITHERTLF